MHKLTLAFFTLHIDLKNSLLPISWIYSMATEPLQPVLHGTFLKQEPYGNPTQGQTRHCTSREVLPSSSESFFFRNKICTLLSKCLLTRRHLALQVGQLCHNLVFSHFWSLQAPTYRRLQCLGWGPADRKAFTQLGFLLFLCFWCRNPTRLLIITRL